MSSIMTPSRPAEHFQSCNGIQIYRIVCDASPSLSGHVLVLLGAGPPTLVDAGNGLPQSLAQITHGIDAVRRNFGVPLSLHDIRRIIVTHGHVDHIGGLAELAGRTRAEVIVHPLDSRAVTAFDEHAVISSKATRAFLCRAGTGPDMHRQADEFFGHVGRSQSVPVAFYLNDGHEFDGMRIIHTPGHSPGHVCIAIGDVLLSGDHILPITVTQQWPESLGAYLCPCQLAGTDFSPSPSPPWNGGEGRGCRGRGLVPLLARTMRAKSLSRHFAEVCTWQDAC